MKKIIILSLLLFNHSNSYADEIIDEQFVQEFIEEQRKPHGHAHKPTCEFIESDENSDYIQKTITEKDMTVCIYIANDNDLDYFAKKNLIDMKKIGSTPYLNIVVQVDAQGISGKSKRYYVEKNKLIQVNKNDPVTEKKLDFGNTQTLIDCCMWAIKSYPAKHYTLVLWNHGIGILDNIGGKTSTASELFNYNPETNMLELNRTISFIEYSRQKEEEERQRGICFSDTFGTYLTNAKLIQALSTVQQNLNGFKFDIIAFDACLMSMLEIGNLLKPYANIMVGSQELELGAGYPYHKVFEPYLEKALTPHEFAQHMVNAYGSHYKLITSDYTLSAVDLEKITKLEESLEQTVQLLVEALKNQKNHSVQRLIIASKNRRLCTCFAEPTYIDLYDFLTNLIDSTDYMLLQNQALYLKDMLLQPLQDTQAALKECVIANSVGKNLSKAQGISIYFPSKSIDSSYFLTPFVKQYSWINLLKMLV